MEAVSTLTRDAMGETYNDVRGLLVDTCCKFQEKYGGDLEEYISETSDYFCRAFLKYRKNKRAQFTTWVRHRVWLNLLENYRRQQMRNKRIPRTGYDPDNYVAPPSPEFNLQDLLGALSEDAATVVQLVLEEPVEFTELLKRQRGRRDTKLQTYIQDCLDGWSRRRVENCFQEIREALA